MKTNAARKRLTVPRFEFQFTRQFHQKAEVIVEGEVIHHIMNLHGFYNALCYTDEMRDAGLKIDEFIKQEYQKDKPSEHEICLHAKLIEYLINYSPRFRKVCCKI